MDRREFFRRAAGKAAQTAVKEADRRVEARAAHWIRPPYARPELEFLLACTRCGACVEACPHGVVFALPARVGARAAATPALDLLNKACHLCEGWPCVVVCEPDALRLPEHPSAEGRGEEEPAEPPLPRLARVYVDTQTCLPYKGPECGACAGSCPVPGALYWDGDRPRIDAERCTGCAQCREACILEPKAILISSLHRSTGRDGASPGR